MNAAAPKIFIVACESSGDSHGAHLVAEIKKQSPSAVFRGLGGPRMLAEDVETLEDMTRISALGWGDVIRQYRTYQKIFNRALAEIREWKPDLLILIDSPAFNLRLAKKIRKSIPTVYYIAPQIWAWGWRRIHTIKRTVSEMLAILPFEKAIYDEAGVPCEFVGHPLLDRIQESPDRFQLRARLVLHPFERAIGLLPGSRAAEIERILPAMLQTASILRDKLFSPRFFLGRSPNVDPAIYDRILARYPGVEISPAADTGIYDLIRAMDFALVTSGTATLETALLGTPFFLLYKTSWSTYFLGKHLIRIPFLGIVNILLGKRVIPEFIQNDLKPETLAHEATVFLNSPALYEGMKEDFAKLKTLLGEGGASARAAAKIMDLLHPPAV